MFDQIERIEQSSDGLQRLQVVVENCTSLNGAFTDGRERCLSIEHSQENMVSLLLDAKAIEQHVHLSRKILLIKNRPYHLKNDKIEDLTRTSTNIIAGTLFNEGSVIEY